MYLQKLALSGPSRNSLKIHAINELLYCCGNRMEVAGFDVSMYKTLILVHYRHICKSYIYIIVTQHL